MHEIHIILKNGRTVVVHCKEYTVEWSKVNGTLISYAFKGIEDTKPLYLNPAEVAAITEKLLESEVTP